MEKSIHNRFLETLMDSKMLVEVYLKHGVKLKGKIVGFDDNPIFLQGAEGKVELVLIDSVSTLTPTICLEV